MTRPLDVNHQLLIALSLLSTLACGTGPELRPVSEEPRDESGQLPLWASGQLSVWAHDARLEASARNVAERIERATGLEVVVNAEGTMTRAIPLFFSEAGKGDSGEGEWLGYSRFRSEPGAGWTAINPGTLDAPDLGVHSYLDTVVLHELVHQFGVLHLPSKKQGLMNDPPHVYDLTADDLELLCSAPLKPARGSSPRRARGPSCDAVSQGAPGDRRHDAGPDGGAPGAPG